MKCPKCQYHSAPKLLCLILAFVPVGTTLFAQQVPSKTTVAPASGAEKDAVIELSPFEVTADDRGYYGANTTSGTRLNSKIEDLAASITVITKQQMEDFAMLDINDIFAYEAGTEGTGNYTQISFDQNGAITDSTTLDPQGSNRIRGLGAANTTFGNFETSGRVPIDPINIDAVEISRGPNSSIFGIGNTAGTVNSVPASANLSANRAQVTARGDSEDGYRTSLDVNRVLKRGVLAVRGSAVYEHAGFHLKPSGTDTVRLNGMIKYRPFKPTTLSASFSDYRMHGNRPNYVTPSDGITDWIANGRPAWDPVKLVTTVNGVTQPTSSAVFRASQGNTQLWIDQGNLAFMTLGHGGSPIDPTISVGSTVYRESNFRVVYPNQPLFVTALPVTDRSIYDWSSINLAAANYYHDDAQTASVALDQILLASGRQKLAVQLAWFRENTERFSRVVVGIPRSAGNSNPLFVDVNSKLLDGTPNPYFGRPYMLTQPYTEQAPLDRDTYRAQAAYKLDLREEKNWTHWLGLHELSAYAEYKNVVQRVARWRDTIVSNPAWFPAGVARGTASSAGLAGLPTVPTVISAPLDRIYVGDANGANVDYGTSYFRAGNYPFLYGNGATFTKEPVDIGSAISDGTGVGGNTLTILKSRGVVWQSHFLHDRIVPTFGWRHDESYTRIGGPIKSPDGIHLDYKAFNNWAPGDWTKGAGPTKTIGAVIKPFSWLSLFANKSDSFRPSAPKEDLYLNKLPDPNGVGEDYGIALNLLKGKLVVRVNRYKDLQLKTPNGPSGTFVQRIRRVDFNIFNQSSPPGLADLFNLQRLATGWVQSAATAQGTVLTAAQTDAKVADIMKLPVVYMQPPSFPSAAADDTLARGTEVEINYNPNNSWTMKLNITEQETINLHIAPELTQWVNERMPVWQSIIDPTTGKNWFTTDYGNGTAATFVAANITSQIAQVRATEGQARPQIRKYRANFSTNFRLAGITEQKYLKRFNIGGAVRWEDKGAIGYYGVQQPPVIVTAYDNTRPVYDKAHTYIDLLLGYRARLFSDKVPARFQLNVRNALENGRLQPIAAFPDGRPYAYRIIDPRIFILSTTFDL